MGGCGRLVGNRGLRMTCLQYLVPMSRFAATESLQRIWRSPSTSPFLPVLLGEHQSCRSAWADACCHQNDPPCVVTLSNNASLLELCVTAILGKVNLYERSLELLASATRLPLGQLKRKTSGLSSRQIVAMFDSSEQPCSPTRTFIASCCIHSQAQGADDSLTLMTTLREDWSASVSDSTALAVLLEVVGPAWRAPILCEFFGAFSFDGDAEHDSMVMNLRTILSASFESPSVRIGLAMSAFEYDILMTKVQSTFLTSALREHVFVLLPEQASRASNQKHDDTEANKTSQQNNSHRGNNSDEGLEPGRTTSSAHETESMILDQLRRSLPTTKDSSELLERAKSVLQAAQRCESSEARSLAESFLYDLLNARAETSGLFALNQKMNFTFGSRAAEIDLCCADLRIAIEVDGHYHFSQPESYRRDRRKDLLLQCRDYLVLRFLAEDVVAQMSDILKTVIDAIAWRRSRKVFSDKTCSVLIEGDK
jgi:very-short-patch-repair endonuclease